MEYCEKDEKKPGKYTSMLDNFPGYIQFPHPFMLAHVRAWWALGAEAIKGMGALDWDFQLAEWNAAKELILTYGEWSIKGVSVADVKNDTLPAGVVNMVTEAAQDYVPPFLPSKAQRRIRAVT